MLFRRCAYIKSNVVVIIELRLIIDFHAKIAEKSIRNEIAYLKMFDCKAFSFLKEADTSKKNEKMKSQAFIEYLIKYDFINIFRV
jgi:hypothetical protein